MSSKIILKISKLSISLLSCLVLTVMNVYAQPIHDHSNKILKNNYGLLNSNTNFSDDSDGARSPDSNAAISDNEWSDHQTSSVPVKKRYTKTKSSFLEISKNMVSIMGMNKGVTPEKSPTPKRVISDRVKSGHSQLVDHLNFRTADIDASSIASPGQAPTPPLMPSMDPVNSVLSPGTAPTPPPMPSMDPVNSVVSPGTAPTPPPMPSMDPVNSVLSPGTAPTPPPPVPLMKPVIPPKPTPSSNQSNDEASSTAENSEDSENQVTNNQELNTESSHADHSRSGNIYIIEQNNNISDVSVDKNESKTITSNSKVKNLYNSGNITLSKGGTVGVDLIVTENYIGNNGIVNFSPTVVDNNIFSNKLMIKGNSSGLTTVSINNIGGINSNYLNGLEFIHVDGLSEGMFNQSGRIVAGAYDYSLIRGDGNNRGNWYLTNELTPNTTDNKRIERPEAASYIANLSAANSLFTTTLSDRLGETQFTDRRTGEKKVTSLWLRQVGNHNNWYDGNNQLKTQSKSYVTQLGGDIMQWSSNGHKRGRLGLMAGYGNNSSNSSSSITNYHSKGSVKGYSVGSYTTWFANNTDKSGLYVDGWIQYNWLDNHVQGQQLSKENYTSKGINASVETGYTIKVGEFIKNKGMAEQWFIQPQAQITKMGVKAKKHREANGTRVISGGEDNIQTRLGVRTYLKGQHAMDKDKNREFEPFIEANWLHNTRQFNTTLDGDRVTQAGTRNIGEVKIGVAGKINSKVNIWGNVGAQVADKGYSSTSVTVGIKYNF